MTSIANYIVEPSNKIEEKEKKVPLYEHASLHMVLKKIINHDKILLSSNEGKNQIYNYYKKIFKSVKIDTYNALF